MGGGGGIRKYRADIFSPLCAGGHWWATQVVKHISDQGNQRDNISTRIRFFITSLLSTWHCGPKIWFGLGGRLGVGGGGWTDAPSRLFMKGIGLSPSLSLSFSSFFPFVPFPRLYLLSLMSLRSKCNASTINYWLIFCRIVTPVHMWISRYLCRCKHRDTWGGVGWRHFPGDLLQGVQRQQHSTSTGWR